MLYEDVINTQPGPDRRYYFMTPTLDILPGLDRTVSLKIFHDSNPRYSPWTGPDCINQQQNALQSILLLI